MTRDLLRQVSEVKPASTKVTVVGVGQVGMAAAFSIMVQGVANELALVDVMADKLQGEMMDLQHGQAFTKRTVIKASTDYSVSAGSKVCVVTAGVRQKIGESRLELVQRNTDIFKSIIPNLVKYSPDTILMIVSNPVDILTYVAWKLSGLPKHRVIGTGTMLDSSRFRFCLSERLRVCPSNVHGYIIGEHGDSSVPVWSGVNVGGVRLSDLQPSIGNVDDASEFRTIHKEVIDSAYNIIKLKGYTSWAIGLMVSTLCNAIIKNQRSIFAVTTHVKGYHNITDDVFLSLPCVIGETGITHVLQQTLTSEEVALLQKSASTMQSVASGISF